MKLKYIVFLGLQFWIIISESKIPSTKLHTYNLDHKKIKMSWVIDWQHREVLFNIQNALSSNFTWFYWGLSSRGEFSKSDVCLFQIDSIFISAMDLYTSHDGRWFNVDDQQDCDLIRQDGNDIAFKRKFDTCDNDDIIMHEGTMYVLWGRGTSALHFENRRTFHIPEIQKHNNGSAMIQLLRADSIQIPEKKFQHIEIKHNNVEIPARDTTYWCKIQKLDKLFRKKHHIIQFQPIVDQEAFVHHMEIFHCETDVNTELPLYEGDCDDMPKEGKVCSKVMSLWAMGASAFTYPEETGMPIGGEDFNPYIRLEVHYNNPDIVAGARDSSGMRIKVTDELRKYDAGVMELGLEYTDKMAIPPGQIGFPLSGYCIAECTNIALPREGITIFGSQLHTHLRGVRVITRHMRGDIELPEINRDDFYSHHFQEIRQLRKKPVVMPGDALVTTCYYTTIGYENATLGGFSIQDEMCVNYIQYYPATKLELCKSSVSEETLADFFRFGNQQPTGPRSENYRGLTWDPQLTSELYTMYIEEPLSMQCNQSNGYRFPGANWEGAKTTSLPILPPMHERSCNKIADKGKGLENGLCDLLGECIY